MPKISVIIPVYNGEQYLEKCLNSIVNQSFKDMEVIVINDGSTDTSELIIDKYIKIHPNIFKKINKKNGGQGSARNLGIENSIGTYIIFIDADDYIDHNMLNHLYLKAQHENSDIVICDYYEIYDNTKKYKKGFEIASDSDKINYMFSNPAPWNKLIKKSIIKENNIRFLEKYIYEDMATMPILAEYSNVFSYVKEPLYNYIIRSGSTMRQKKYNKKLDSIFFAIEYLENEFKKRKIYDKYKEELEFLVITHLLYSASGRFIQYPEGKEKINKIIKIMNLNYPNWRKNKYYLKQSLKFKLTCNIFYKNNSILLNLYIKFRNK